MGNYDFKFKWVDDDGNEQGFRSKRGSLSEESLQLDQTEIPIGAILDVASRKNRFLLSVALADETAGQALFALQGGKLKVFEKLLGQYRGAMRAKYRREQLAEEGRASEFRAIECPHCESTLDLTGFPVTPEVYCEYCDAIYTQGEGGSSFDTTAVNKSDLKTESKFRLCDECDMYSRPQQFTIFYFYFLLVVYGFSSQQTWRCPACMRGEAWKMLFGNLFFVLGVPVAVVQLVRSYSGSQARGPLAKLDAANIKARGGKLNEAIDTYQSILKKKPVAAGVKYNIALALLGEQGEEPAAKMLEYSLADCSNYRPAAGLLLSCYEKLNQSDKKVALEKQWDIKSEDEPEEPATEP